MVKEKMSSAQRLAENNKQRRKMRRKRQVVLAALGGKCVRCGFEDERALQIDHINGQGQADVRTFTSPGNYYKAILADAESGGGKYQLLCANCNWIKRAENHEVRNGKLAS